MRVKLGVTALLACALAGTAQAQLVIGFHTGPFVGAGGTITYAGGSTPLVGTDIPVQLLTSAGTPANSSAFLLSGFGSGTSVHANINFTTGTFASYSGGIYTFNGGGTFTITGGVPAIPIPDGTALVTGAAIGATFDSSQGILNITLVNGTDHKDPTLLTFFGLPTDMVFKFTGTIHNFFLTGGGGDAFTAQASGSTDVENRLQTLSLACSGGTGQVGVAYNSSLVATGGLGPYTYSIPTGQLPTGLTLNPTTGAITGTPSSAGTFTFTAQVTDSSGQITNLSTATSNCTIVITPPQPLTIQCAAATGQVGVVYNSALVANGGVPPYTFSITSGVLPAGLTLNTTTGAITGTPTTAGTFNFTAQVVDSTNSMAGTKTTNCAIVIAPGPLKLQCAGSTGQVGVAYNSALVATGGTAPYTYSITLGSLPPGLTLNTTTGAITGTPTSAGSYTFTAQVTDSSGNVSTNTTTSSCGITISPAPLNVVCATSTGKVGTPYSSAFVASGGTPAYTFAITAGSLPPGLTLNPSTGALAGTPTSAGTFNFTVTVTDSKGDTAGTASSNCSITIAPPTITVICITSTGTVGTPYSSAFVAAGGTAPYTYGITAGTLPPGLTLNTTTGAVTGTPTTAGAFNFTVTATDSTTGQAATVSSNCSVTINPPVSATCVVINAVQGVPIAPVTMTATGGTGTGYTFSASGLPTGLTMSAGGTISGTPTVSGTFPYTVTVTDSAGNTGTFNCSVTVVPPVSATCVVINAVQGVAITPVTMVATGGTGTGYTFSASGLPTGLTMSAGGTISGTPTVTGTFPYTVTVTDSAGNKGTFNCSVTVVPPVSATCVVINAVQGVPITPVTMIATGGTGTGYTFSASGLPTGLTMSAGGTISGTPTVSGTFPYTVTVTDSAGNKGTFNCSVTVVPPVSATCVVINAIRGVAITPVTMIATGGTGTGYTFSASGLPTGLTMSAGGTISGTPTVSGTFPYTVTVTDSAGNKGTFNCSVTVIPPVSATCVVINAIRGVAITPVTMIATGGTGTGYTFSASGLPTGLTMSAGGTISGTPTVSGIFPYTVTVTDSAGNKGTFNCSVTVIPPVSATCVVINAMQGVAITPVTLTATGGAGGPYTFSATGLPAGLTLSSTGTLSGTPLGNGAFPYTVVITDAAGNTGTLNCSVTVTSSLPPCGVNLGPLTYNVSENGSNVANEIVWFNSHLVKLGGTIPTTDFTVYVQNGKITFGTATLSVPNAVIRFTSSVNCASTTFDTVSNEWITTIPLSAASNADEIFAAGLAYQLPANFAQNVNNLSWSATVYSTASALQVSWQYGVSNWLTQKNGTLFPVLVDGSPDYNGMMINPAHNAPLCNASYSSGDHAGAPEFPGRSNVLTGGGSGGGGSNWTGSWSSTPAQVGFICANGAIGKGDTATIGFWHNKNGQALITSLNGGPASTALANWLASQFPYLYGANSTNNMTNKTNADVAALFLTFFNVSGQKTNAQILAGALASYVTSSTLAGTSASQYGFNSSTIGTGGRTYNVGTNGTLIGLLNNTAYPVLQLLQQANLAIQNGTFNANAFNTIFDGINQLGDIK